MSLAHLPVGPPATVACQIPGEKSAATDPRPRPSGPCYPSTILFHGPSPTFPLWHFLVEKQVNAGPGTGRAGLGCGRVPAGCLHGGLPVGGGFQWAGGLQFCGLGCQTWAHSRRSAEQGEHRVSGDLSMTATLLFCRRAYGQLSTTQKSCEFKAVLLTITPGQ